VLGVAQRRCLGIRSALLLADVGMAQDIQPLRISGHHAILNAVVDHLDEVARATGTAVQIAVFGCAAGLLPAGRAGRGIDVGGKSGKDGINALDDGIIAADHQAVSSLRPPDPTAGACVHIVNAFRLKLGRAADVIVVVRVAAIDDHVVGFEERNDGLQRRIDHSGRYHHPDGAGHFQLARKIFKRIRPNAPSLTSACTASEWRS
jgi:hypothetical protein